VKLKLNPDKLVVTTFAVATPGQQTVLAVTPATNCLCTREAGCYPSQYCSVDGPYVLTCAPDCMTNQNGYC
jgi:hypothetical protein